MKKDGSTNSNNVQGKAAAVSPNEQLEKALFQEYYDPLFLQIRNNTISYTVLSERTGFKERRIREALCYRLGVGDVRQLFGRQPGICYMCDQKMANLKEPVCMRCTTALSHAATMVLSTGVGAFGTVSAQPEAPITVAAFEYHAIMEELEAYRTLYGPLAKHHPEESPVADVSEKTTPVSIPPALVPLSATFPISLEGVPQQIAIPTVNLPVQKVETALHTVDEETLILEMASILDEIDSFPSEGANGNRLAIKHYSFQRHKSGRG